MRPTSSCACSAAVDGPTIVCAQAGNVNTGAMRPARRDRGRRSSTGRLAARRRRVRPVGGGEPAASRTSGRGPRARRLVGGRRAQVAERPAGHGVRDLRRPLGAPRVARHRRALPAAGGRRRSRSVRARPRVVASRPRLPGLRRAALARPLGRGRARRALLRARRLDGCGARSRGRRRGAERRHPEPGARALRRRRRPDARGDRPRAAGWNRLARAARSGRGAPRCASRSRATRRPSRMRARRLPRSSARGAASLPDGVPDQAAVDPDDRDEHRGANTPSLP